MKLHEIALKLLRPEREPDRIIGGRENPYMYRWWLIPRNRFFNVYLHFFMRSDDDRAVHDHPWWNASWLLSGRYKEVVPTDQARPQGRLWKIEREAGDVAIRRATTAHRIELYREITQNRNEELPAWTIFITGPRIRDWGFWCPAGWRPWQQFVDNSDGTSRVGRGCE